MRKVVTQLLSLFRRPCVDRCPQPPTPHLRVSAILEGVTLCLMIIHSHLSLPVPSEELCSDCTGNNVFTAVSLEGLERVHSLQLFFLTAPVFLYAPLY